MLKQTILKELETCKVRTIGTKLKSQNLERAIIEATSFLTPDVYKSFTQRIWHIVHDVYNIVKCPCGNNCNYYEYKYTKFCSQKCPKCLDSKSQKCKAAQLSKTTAQKRKIRKKKLKTNQTRHKNNSGATATGIANHTAFYKDKGKVKIANEKCEATCLEKYNVTHVAKLTKVKRKIKRTLKKKYGVTNPGQTTSSLEEKSNRKTNVNKLKRTRFDNSYDAFTKALEKQDFEIHCSKNNFSGYMGNKYTFKHNTCGNIFEYRCKGGKNNMPICQKCNPINRFKSKQENELYRFIKTIRNDAYQSDRTIIYPKELDIVIPSLKIAIEYCGILWHSEIFGDKDKKYHQTKMINSNIKDYRLITIFEDEWQQNKDIVKNKLRTILQNNDIEYNSSNIFIKKIDENKSLKFIKQYQISNIKSAQEYYGAFYNEELVAVMSFKQNVSNCWEIVHNYSKIDKSFIYNSLFETFIKDYSPKKVFSIIDLRWEDGNNLKNMNMSQTVSINPMSFYIEGRRKRILTTANMKKKFIKNHNDNFTLTYKESVFKAGYDFIWDCGRAKFEINF